MKTLMSSDAKLMKDEECESVDSTKYRGMIEKTALAISTTEAEYVSTRKACQQALWMKQPLIDYDVRLDDVPIICDNKGAIDLSKNPVQHSRTKHIEIRHHFLHDNVQKGHISIEKVSSVDNIADILTKPLKRELFNYLRLGLGMMGNGVRKFLKTNVLAKLPMLKLGEYEMWEIRIKQYFLIQYYALRVFVVNRKWELLGILFLFTAPESGPSTALKMTVPSTAEEKIAKRMIFGGNEATKKTQKALLKQQYENFNASSSESLDSIFNRLQKLVSRLAILGVVTPPEDLNVKFLRSLPSEWDTHVVVWMNKPDFDTMGLDDLYNNFKIVEQKVKKSTADNNDDKNLAFLTTSSPSRRNGSKGNMALISYEARSSIRELEGRSSLMEVVLLDMINQKSVWSPKNYLMGITLKTELEKVKEEKEGFEFKIAKFQKSSKDLDQLLASQITDKSKKGFGYNVVPSPHPLILNRPTSLDLSYSGLQEFKQPKTDSSLVKSPLKVDKDWKEKFFCLANQVREEEPKKARENNDVPIIEDWESDDEEEVEPIPKVKKKTAIPTATKKESIKIEKPIRRSVSCPNAHKHMVPRAVLMKTGLKTVNMFWSLTLSDSFSTARFQRSLMEVYVTFGSSAMEAELLANGLLKLINLILDDVILKDASYFDVSSPKSVADAQIQDQDRTHDDCSLQNNGTADQQVNTASPEVNAGSREVNIVVPEVNTATLEDLMGPIPTSEDTQVEDQEIELGTFSPSNAVSSTPHTEFTKISNLKDSPGPSYMSFCLFLSQEEQKEFLSFSDPAMVEHCQRRNSLQFKLYMIGSLMYLTASIPDIMFAVCACARFQVSPKTSHLLAVKRIFRYLKGKPSLGLWYSKDSLLELVAYTDSDYVGATLSRKSTTGGCQCLGNRLISWQCKKQTVVATSTTEAEYVAAASCCGQFYDKHNMVAFLEKSTGSAGFHQIIDFINRSHICYALTKKPEVCVSFIKQFWRSAEASTGDNGGVKINATIDGHSLSITEGSLRRHLKLADQDGITSILNLEIFEQLVLMGYHTDSDKLTFQKGVFSPQWRITSSPSHSPAPSTSHSPEPEPSTQHSPNNTTAAASQLSPTQPSPNIPSPGAEKLLLQPYDLPLHAADLMKTKKTYSSAYTKLILRVKKLESQIKIRKARRQARVVLSDDEVFEDDSSKQGRKLSDAELKKKAILNYELFIQEVTSMNLLEGLPEKMKSAEKMEEDDVAKETGAKRKKSIPRKSTRKRQKMDEDCERRTQRTLRHHTKRRASSKNYKILSEMLKDFDRLDVEELYRLVKERYNTSRPEGFDLILWGDLHTLFEPDEDDEIWKDQHEYNLIS
ncbi:hypothetical protein Tco_0117854 [Tanacetum coccineum]